MGNQREHDYPRAPITVTTRSGRKLDFELNHDGHVEITAEVPDYSSWIGSRTMEVSFWMTAEDWRAVVQHIESEGGK